MLCIERPTPFTSLAAPVAEASDLIDHIANVVLPTLCTGLAIPKAIPRGVDLGDAPTKLADRLSLGVNDSAQTRSARKSWERMLHALERPMQIATIVEVNEFTGTP